MAYLDLSASAIAHIKRYGFNYAYIVNRAVHGPKDKAVAKKVKAKKPKPGFLCDMCKDDIHDCRRVKCVCPKCP